MKRATTRGWAAAAVLAAAWAIALATPAARADQEPKRPLRQPDGSTRITLMQINDVYTLMPVDGGKRGGMARVATLVRQARQENRNTLFVLGGDTISPAVASSMFKGKQMIDGLNAAGLDLAVPGNHEFDFGTEVLRARIAESKFQWLCANAFEADGKRPFAGMKPWVIRPLGGVKVGIFGVTTVGESVRADLRDVRFEDPLEAAGRAIGELTSAGAEVIVALTHLDLTDDRALARTHPEVQVIVGGHEHEEISLMVGPTLISKAGSDARSVARIDIDVARQGKAVLVDRSLKLLPVLPEIPEDRLVAKIAAGYETELERELSEVVGGTKEPLDVRSHVVRNSESALGNFLVDSMRETTGADVAMINSGSMRSDRVFPPGPLTRRDVLSILPFGNIVVTVEMTGADILEALEYSVARVGQSFGRFLQVSGVRFEVDPTRPPGSRVYDVRIHGVPVQADKVYKVSTLEFLRNGGDGYQPFARGRTLINSTSGPLLAMLAMDRIKLASPIAPRVDGRIRIQGGAPQELGPVRVIADVDPGVDGAMALLYLLRNPRVQLEAVTVVNGITTIEAGVRNVHALLQATGRGDVPIGAGRPRPLVGAKKFPDFWRDEADRMTGTSLPKPSGTPQVKDAEELTVEIAQRRPGEVVYIALGPLTNLAAAMTRRPELRSELKEVVFMGGAAFVEGNLERPFVGIHNKVAEWNVYVDAHAAAQVIDSGLPFTMVGLDATDKAPVTEAFRQRLLPHAQDPAVGILLKLLDTVNDAVKSGWYFFWDPLAAVAAIEREVVEQEEHTVSVITTEGPFLGHTKVVGRGGSKVVVAVDARVDAFEDAFLRPLVH